jgi:hypothetical protein
MLLNQDAKELPSKLYLPNFTPTESEFIFDYRINKEESTFENKNQLKIQKVLVDVECSHDGSLKHVLKYFFHPTPFPKPKKNKNTPDFIISNKEKKRRAKQAQESNKIKKSKPKTN